MRSFLKYSLSLFETFATLVSGGVLGVYYLYVEPAISNWRYKRVIDIAVPIFAMVVTVFLVWRNQQKKIKKLEDQLKKEKDKKPKYKFAVIDATDVLESKIKKIDKRITSAKDSRAKAPAPNPWLPSLSAVTGSRTTVDWDNYISELTTYKTLIQAAIDNKDFRIINFTLENSGFTDTNINVQIVLDGLEQSVEFYEKKFVIDEPSAPGSFNFISSIPSISKLGMSREVQTDSKDYIDVEIDRLRNNETVNLHHYPVFVKKVGNKEPQITYTIKSDGLSKEITKTKTFDF